MKKLRTITKLFIIMMLALPCISPNHATAHWTSKGPYGGSIRCITVADTNIVVGTFNGGVFMNTTPAANIWKAYNTGMTSGKISAVAQMGRKTIAATIDAGIFISDDRGANWTERNSGLGNLNMQALFVSGANVFAGSTGGVFLSTDSGNTWAAVNTGITNLNITCFVSNGSDIYVGTYGGGVFKTSNNGTLWTGASTGITNQHITSLVVANGNLLAASGGGVYSTPLSSISWLLANAGLSGIFVNCLYAVSGNIYAGSTTGMYSSPDAAIVWTNASAGLPADAVQAIGAYAGKLYVGTQSNGVYSSPLASINLTASRNGFNGLKTNAIAALDTLVLVTATEKGIHRSVDLAANYAITNSGLTDSLNVNCMAFGGTKLFAGTMANGMFMSTDTGNTWVNVNTGLTSTNVRAIVTTATDIYAGTADGKVFKSALSGVSWSSVSTGLPSSLVITGMAVSGGNVYLSAAGAGVLMYNGTTWADFNTGLTNKVVTCITTYKSRVYVGTGSAGVFVSPLTGAAWTTLNDSLPTLNITAINAADSYVIVGYRGGVKFTSDNGKYWLPPNVQIYIPTYADVSAIAFSAQRIFVATPYNSFYSNSKTEVPEVGKIPTLGIHDVAATPNATGNIMVSPNPNNGSFDIDIKLTYGTVINEVAVYDITGKLMGKLQNLQQQKVNANYPKGAYFIHVSTNNGVITQKMIVQ